MTDLELAIIYKQQERCELEVNLHNTLNKIESLRKEIDRARKEEFELKKFLNSKREVK